VSSEPRRAPDLPRWAQASDLALAPRVLTLRLEVLPKERLDFSRKEVIQPQVPLRLPCYDFTPVTSHSLKTCLPCGLARPFLEQLTPMV
jgi:hypothetical protein